MPRLHGLTRDLHLYFGLFVSPFVVVFAVSVFFLVHAWLPKPDATEKRTLTDVAFPADLETLKGREQALAVQALLAQHGAPGELMMLRHLPRDRRFTATLHLPGRETTADLRLAPRTVELASRTTGLADATVYLHKMPGPHNVAIRGNAAFMRAWRWLADATVYLIMFATLSGVYLWAGLKTERRTGLAFLALGAATFGGLVYALV